MLLFGVFTFVFMYFGRLTQLNTVADSSKVCSRCWPSLLGVPRHFPGLFFSFSVACGIYLSPLYSTAKRDIESNLKTEAMMKSMP